MMQKKVAEILPMQAMKTTRATNTAANPAASATTRPNDIYVYGVGMLAFLAIGVCVFFAYNTFQLENKKQTNKKKGSTTKTTSYALEKNTINE